MDKRAGMQEETDRRGQHPLRLIVSSVCANAPRNLAWRKNRSATGAPLRRAKRTRWQILIVDTVGKSCGNPMGWSKVLLSSYTAAKKALAFITETNGTYEDFLAWLNEEEE